MDTFFEQIIPIRKTGKTISALLGIWLLTVIVIFVLLLFIQYIGTLIPILIAAAIFGAYKLCCRFNIEYEYIVTNGTMDIDKIINKSSRKRILSLELSTVSSIEKYNAMALASKTKKDITVACSPDDPEAYLMVSAAEGKGAAYLIFVPDERLRGAIAKFVPKFVANSAFK